MDWVATGEWRSNPTLDTHVRQEMTNPLEPTSELAATVVAAERAQRTRPLLHPELRKRYREWMIECRAERSSEPRTRTEHDLSMVPVGRVVRESV
jgi:hypothetical protein